MTCEHKFIHFDTIKSNRYDGRFNTQFKRIDKFFCEKCLEVKDVAKEEWSRDKPEWY